jgi:S-adenosylmethionine decarboxylase
MLGKHYLLNLYECSHSLLNDEKFLRGIIELAAVQSGATIIKTHSKSFYPQGVTAFCLLSESHISIHTWPEKGEAAADVFTCGDCEPKIGCEFIVENLQAKRHTLQYIER